jgi:hypothetical protein
LFDYVLRDLISAPVT